MSFSLTVIIALCVLLPGATFVFGYTRIHSPNSTPTPLDQHLPIGLAVALLVAVLFNALWLGLWSAILRHFPTLPVPDARQVVALLGGDLKASLAQAAIQSIGKYPIRIAFYFFSLPLAAWLAGKWLNRLMNLLRPKEPAASWYTLLRPKGPDFVWLTTDLHLDGRCYLYAGVVSEFSIGKDGGLERVVLGAAVRKPLTTAEASSSSADPQIPESEPEDENTDAEEADPLTIGNGWKEIPGEFVVLQMDEALTVNIDYFYIDEKNGEAQPTSRN